MNEVNKEKVCVVCGRKDAPTYKGMREGRIRCGPCYSREKHYETRRKKKAQVYDMWGG